MSLSIWIEGQRAGNDLLLKMLLFISRLGEITVGQPQHTRLLTAAAREVLRPLGLRQRGRSRLWFDDQTWWLVVVEFQPSSWSKGSYLNVGAMWLWLEKDYYSFDDGCRVEDFARFEDESRFSQIAKTLAFRAAEEVRRFRSAYPSIHAVAGSLAAKSPVTFWNSFHAGVACGLSGNLTDARRLFEEVAATDDREEWAQAAVSLARDYSASLSDLSAFRQRIKEVVARTRGLLRLGEVDQIEFGGDKPGRSSKRPPNG
jgi:hypothetical protein